jgi:hypothetical protein
MGDENTDRSPVLKFLFTNSQLTNAVVFSPGFSERAYGASIVAGATLGFWLDILRDCYRHLRSDHALPPDRRSVLFHDLPTAASLLCPRH